LQNECSKPDVCHERFSSYPQRKKHHLDNVFYTVQSFYFITIVTHKRKCLFGTVNNENTELTDEGKMVLSVYKELAKQMEKVIEPTVVVMPNHIHFVIFNNTDGKESVKDFVQQFKRLTTNCYIEGVKRKNWQPFDGRLWQRDYYDHMIRNQREFDYIVNYIYMNPQRWRYDLLNKDHESITDNVSETLNSLK